MAEDSSDRPTDVYLHPAWFKSSNVGYVLWRDLDLLCCKSFDLRLTLMLSVVLSEETFGV